MAAPDTRQLTPVLVGPTGVGKTDVAVALAAHLPITVISADARQVYRGLDVGTAKPDAATLARVPHRGLDLVDPGERYSAGRFARDAAGWIAEARAAGREPIVVGGTGLYVRALAEGLFREPPLDAGRRDALRGWTEAQGGGMLARWAGRLDPRFPGGGRQRAARAVEVALLTGRSLSWWQRAARDTGVVRPWYIHLTLPRGTLHQRLAARVDRMLAAGWVAEVRRLLAAGTAPDAPGLDGVGYREIVAMLQGRLPEPALRDAIVVATRRYAKRQETWFRHQLRQGGSGKGEGDVVTLDAGKPPEVLAEAILARWNRRTLPASPFPLPPSRSMRIGITCYPTYGGSGAIATELGLELARRGHEVHFISYASPFRLRGYVERVTFHEVTQLEYPLFEHSSPYALALAVKQHEVAMREALDLMHVHYAIPHAATAWLAKQMLQDERDLKIVTTLHGTDITLVGQDPSYYTLTKFSIERSDAVTAVSRYLRDETYRAFGCGDCRVEVIPNFVSPADYHPPSPTEGERARRRPLAPAGHRVVVHVSNFRPVKRVADVVRIFAAVRQAMPATLVLVGDGPERDGAEHLADRLGLRKDVRFLGKVDHVGDVLRGADLFLLPSATESFGLAALEAMACGVPVVATAVGGLPEVVTDGETGALAPVGDVPAMAAHAVRILHDPAEHERLRRNAAARALEFSAERIIPRYERLYEEVLR